jgi:hypothetical protein
MAYEEGILRIKLKIIMKTLPLEEPIPPVLK